VSSRKKLRAPEHYDQAEVVSWATALTPVCPDLGLLFAVPNGARMQPWTVAKAKAEGLRAGVPDLVLPVPRHPYHGLFLEMKAPGKYPTSEQRWWRDALQAHAYCWQLCRSGSAGIDTLCTYLGIDRAGRRLQEAS